MTVFFDLFWTLIAPEYDEETAENRLLGLSKEEWGMYQEAHEVSDERYLGHVKSEDEMMRKIVALLPFSVSEELYLEVVRMRRERIRKGITRVAPEVLGMLELLKARGHRLCLISNADLMDIHYWDECPLKDVMDQVIFSCEAGVIKPDTAIYRLGLERMKAEPRDSIFIGDGGSDELAGARRAGMKTVLTEHYSVKEPARRNRIREDADYVLSRFEDLAGLSELL